MTYPDPMQQEVDPVAVINLLRKRVTDEVGRSVTLEAQLQAAHDREQALIAELQKAQADLHDARRAALPLPEDSRPDVPQLDLGRTR